MIRNQWYAVLESNEVRQNKPVGVLRMGERLVFWRDAQGKIACLSDQCPHRGVALSLGRVQGECLECPFHGFQFAADGSCLLAPSNGRAAPPPRQIHAGSYPAREANGFIFIWWGEADQAQGAPRFFDDLAGMPYRTTRVPWKAHYSRAIENQLDVAHLPYVHRTTIGSGGETLVDGPFSEWLDPDRLRVFYLNRVDDGSLPLRPDQVQRPAKNFWLDFIFPNLWQNHLGAGSRVVLAFVPVDDGNTMMYLRFYQGFVRLPLLSQALLALSTPFNRAILKQDQGVVESHRVMPSALKSGEKLVQADRPIILYRSRRQELMEAAGQGNMSG
jgi:phenylpropionate dioxygenase-like ring-hydroxylating dioxygenase large terminal subunit